MRQFFSGWMPKDYVTAAIALYAALLSTYMAWTKWRESRAKVKVTIQLAIATLPPIFQGFAIRIGVENHGIPDVSFDAGSAAVKVKGSAKMLVILNPVGNPLPRTLKHGEDLTVLGDLNALTAEIRNLVGPGRHNVRGVIRDKLSRVHKSKWNVMEVK